MLQQHSVSWQNSLQALYLSDLSLSLFIFPAAPYKFPQLPRVWLTRYLKILVFHNLFTSGETSVCHVTSGKRSAEEPLSHSACSTCPSLSRGERFIVLKQSTRPHTRSRSYIHSPARHLLSTRIKVSHDLLPDTNCVRANQRDYSVHEVCSQHLKCTLMWQHWATQGNGYLLLSFIAKNQSDELSHPVLQCHTSTQVIICGLAPLAQIKYDAGSWIC